MPSRLRPALPLAGIAALAAALRFYALTFGLPYLHARPDETTAVGHAAAILAGDLNPHFFNWPSLTLYVFAAALGAAKAAGVTLTAPAEILIARGVVAIAGTLTVLATAAVGRSLAGRSAGLIAAFLLSIAPLHVRESHFAMTDVLTTLLVTTSLALAMAAVDRRSTRLFAAAGAAGGLATSAKYSAGAIVAVAAAAPGLGAAIGFLACWAGAFVAATPFAILDFPAFATDVAYERAHLGSGHTVLLARGWSYHLQTTLPHGLRAGIAIAAAAGLAIAVWKYRKRTLVPAVYAVAFYLSIGAGRTVFFRYALPIVPVACVFAAVAVETVAAAIAARARTAPPAVAWLLAIALATPSLIQSVRLDRLLARRDSRLLAADWLTSQLQPGTTLHDSGGDYTRLELGDIPIHTWRYDAATRSFGDPTGATPEWIVLYDSPLPEYTAAPDALRALVNARYALACRVRGVPARAGKGIYDRQDAFFLPIDGFDGVDRPGPTVSIYRRR